MAGERKQKERIQRTPRKPKTPERHVIGSSSAWKEEELEKYKVQVGGEADVKKLIPEKWFEFGGLKHYQSGMCCALVSNSSARSVDLHYYGRSVER